MNRFSIIVVSNDSHLWWQSRCIFLLKRKFPILRDGSSSLTNSWGWYLNHKELSANWCWVVTDSYHLDDISTFYFSFVTSIVIYQCLKKLLEHGRTGYQTVKLSSSSKNFYFAENILLSEWMKYFPICSRFVTFHLKTHFMTFRMKMTLKIYIFHLKISSRASTFVKWKLRNGKL